MDKAPRMLSPEEMAPFLQKFDGVCWWCRGAPATTGEHKFKRTDLADVMGDDGELVWGSRDGRRRDLRGPGALKRDRHGVIKFPKSLCDRCNNARSQPFDFAYDTFSNHLQQRSSGLRRRVDLREVYVDDWQSSTLNLARYYGKHFGCRLVRAGIPVPESIRTFLDGGEDLADAHMAIITTDTVREQYGSGLSISDDHVHMDQEITRITGSVMAAYVGSLGVRFEWREGWTHEGKPEAWRSQFFHYPTPVIMRFRDGEAVCRAEARPLGPVSSAIRWVNRSR